jgi:hypothetical protein
MPYSQYKNIFLIVFIFLILGMLGFIIYRNKDPSKDSSTVQRNLPDSQSKSSDTKRNAEEPRHNRGRQHHRNRRNAEEPRHNGDGQYHRNRRNAEEPRHNGDGQYHRNRRNAEEPRFNKSNDFSSNSEQPRNFDSNAESNSTNLPRNYHVESSSSEQIPQDDSLSVFQGGFNDSEIENSSSLTLQRHRFRNFEEKINFLRAELDSRYLDQHYGFRRINVNRDTVLQESMDRILSLSPDDLRLTPRISFLNEEGVDAGGLTKEWL